MHNFRLRDLCVAKQRSNWGEMSWRFEKLHTRAFGIVPIRVPLLLSAYLALFSRNPLAPQVTVSATKIACNVASRNSIQTRTESVNWWLERCQEKHLALEVSPVDPEILCWMHNREWDKFECQLSFKWEIYPNKNSPNWWRVRCRRRLKDCPRWGRHGWSRRTGSSAEGDQSSPMRAERKTKAVDHN